MPMIAAIAKITALAVTLTCIGAGQPPPDAAPLPTTSDAGASRLQCRMYFGCTPTGPARTTVAQRQEEYVR